MIVFRPILEHIAHHLACVLDIHPTIVIVRHTVKDLKAQVVGGIDAALDNRNRITLADIDVGSLKGARAVSLHLANADAETRKTVTMSVNSGQTLVAA